MPIRIIIAVQKRAQIPLSVISNCFGTGRAAPNREPNTPNSPIARRVNRRALVVLPAAAVLLATLLGLLAVAGSCDPSGPVRPAHPLVRLTPDDPVGDVGLREAPNLLTALTNRVYSGETAGHSMYEVSAEPSAQVRTSADTVAGGAR